MTVSLGRFHTEWPRLVDSSGTFLTLPVLKRAFPDGLEPVQRDQVARLREELALFREDPETRQRAFVHHVLTTVLGYGPVLREGPAMPLGLAHTVAEHGVTLRPDAAVVDSEGERPHARLLVSLWPVGTDPMRRVPGDIWSASPVDRMAILLRSTASARLGLVTDGLRWVLVSTVTPVTTTAMFDVDIWLEERVTLDAFVTLLRARRLFGVAEADRLEALLLESAGAQDEVTGKLGEQVRQAVELLVAALSRADRETHGRLLAEVNDHQVYAAAVSVMMRLVFLLYAEERRLFPLDDSLYQASYAASTLFDQLEEEARGEVEVLDRRSAAWGRLLALFRAIHDGIQHEDLRLPAYGGSLFDPDVYPFLEGRPTAATPLHLALPIRITDLEVREVLQALQVLRFSSRGATEARRLSYRNLDVEQIGHVYEGLLDHGAKRVGEIVLGLCGKLEPEVPLARLEERRALGETDMRAWVADVTGLTTKQVDRALDAPADELAIRRLRVACDGNDTLAARIAPFLGLVRSGARDLPLVLLPGSIHVTHSSERRSSGTYYTPRLLAEEMVQHALEPLVYSPGPQDTADATRWRLKSAAEILDLRICDMTMGSGAFLVAACRFLADRLLETTAAGGDGQRREGPDDADEVVEARRLVVEHCLYGVDRNPMAVEMAKLSMWLITLAKDRPFTFLDGSFACGDALLGVTSLDQVANLHLDPAAGAVLHGGRLAFADHLREVVRAVSDAAPLRDELASIRVLDVRDAERKRELLENYRRAVAPVKVIADLVVGAALSTATERADALRTRLSAVATELDAALPQRDETMPSAGLDSLRQRAADWLNIGRPSTAPVRSALHWVIDFPEVFSRSRGGFDAIIGNPPYLGNKYWAQNLGRDFQPYWEKLEGRKLGKTDLIVLFLGRMRHLLRPNGIASSLATQSLTEVDSKRLFQAIVLDQGLCIYRAVSSRMWPGSANVAVAILWLINGTWRAACTLDQNCVEEVGPDLRPRTADRERLLPMVLRESERIFAFQGVDNSQGNAFILNANTPLVRPDLSAIVKPYISGDDLVSDDPRRPSRYVIDLTGLSEDDLARLPADVRAYLANVIRPTRTPERLRSYEGMEARWWTFCRTRESGFEVVRARAECLVLPAVAKYTPALRMPSSWVYTNKVIVVADAVPGLQTMLLSAAFDVWLERYGGTMGLGGRVVKLASVMYTFPLPVRLPSDTLAEEWQSAALTYAGELGTGLTGALNSVHNPNDSHPSARELRRLIEELDRTVFDAYGWADLPVTHEFSQRQLGVRFSLCTDVLHEIHLRLLTLNHVATNRQGGKAPRSLKSPTKRSRHGTRLPSWSAGSSDPDDSSSIEGALPLDAA